MKLSVPVTTSTMRLRVLGRLKQEEVESQAVEETLGYALTFLKLRLLCMCTRNNMRLL